MTRVEVLVDWLPTAEAGARFGRWLVPSLERRAQRRTLAERSAVAVAREGGETVGVALGQGLPRPDAGEVLTLSVAERWRRRGLGTLLLRHVEGALAEDGRQTVQGTWRSDWAGADRIAAFLTAAGWSAPTAARLFYNLGQEVMDRPWVSAAALPPAYSLADWATATDADRARVRALLDAEPAARVTTPFQRPDLVDPTCSVWLRHRGEVVGWAVVLRPAPEVAEYAGLYVAPGHRRGRPALATLCEAIRRHVSGAEAAGVEVHQRRGVFVVNPGNRPARTLADRLLGGTPVVEWVAGRRLSE